MCTSVGLMNSATKDNGSAALVENEHGALKGIEGQSEASSAYHYRHHHYGSCKKPERASKSKSSFRGFCGRACGEGRC